MNSFAHFVKKESLHILRDLRTILVVIGIPVLLTLLFGFAISTDVDNIDVAVCAPHGSSSIRQAVSDIDNNGFFTFAGYVSVNEIDEVLRSGRAGVVVVFSDDYDLVVSGRRPGRKAAQIVLDGSNPNVAASADVYLSAALGSGTVPEMFETHILYNPQMKSAYNFVPGILGLIFIIICAMMTSISIVREKETGTMEVLLVSPARPSTIIIAKMIPYFLLSCVNLASILLVAKFALGVPMEGSLTGIILVSLVYIILSLGFGLLVSMVTDKQIVALLISGIVLMLPVIMFSGMLFPVENLPAVLKPFSYIIPARWYIDAIRKMMIEGLGLVQVWKEAAILTVMALGIMKVASVKFNDRLE